MAILVVDNYDSFTFNLVQDLGALGEEVVVRRNDAIDVAGIEAMAPEAIVISPGPCTPNEAGVSMPAIAAFAGRLPILGVCLGHQAMGQALRGKVVRAARLMHGKTDVIGHDGAGVFAGLPSEVRVMRYHSLAIERATLPEALVVTASSADGEIMGVRHRGFAATRTPLEGVQFHPESFLTEHGHAMLRNFLSQARTAS